MREVCGRDWSGLVALAQRLLVKGRTEKEVVRELQEKQWPEQYVTAAVNYAMLLGMNLDSANRLRREYICARLHTEYGWTFEKAYFVLRAASKYPGVIGVPKEVELLQCIAQEARAINEGALRNWKIG